MHDFTEKVMELGFHAGTTTLAIFHPVWSTSPTSGTSEHCPLQRHPVLLQEGEGGHRGHGGWHAGEENQRFVWIHSLGLDQGKGLFCE